MTDEQRVALDMKLMALTYAYEVTDLDDAGNLVWSLGGNDYLVEIKAYNMGATTE